MLVIRDATERDIDFLADLQAMQMRRELPDHDAETLRSLAIDDTGGHVRTPEDGCTLSVIERDGQPVGRLRVVRSSDRLFLAGIQIVPARRGLGIGTEVITRLLSEAGAAGLPVQLRVHRANVDAQRLYARLGFERYDEDDGDLLLGRG